MKQIRLISRIFTGLIFIFSGIVKAVDPMGSTYKFEDYFIAFGLESLTPFALIFAATLFYLEFITGMALVFNMQLKRYSWMALLFMAFFTPLTFILAINNPVTDCGCFGDAVKLTNWETFWKNVIILIFTLVVFVGRKKIVTTSSKLHQSIFLAISLVFVIVISVKSYRHLPLIDFRPYHIGANIKDKMTIPEGAPIDEYQTIFHYEKDGEIKEFDQNNYPWQDTTWKYVDSKQIRIKKGYEPPIHDFSISNETEGDITDLILSDEKFTFLLVAKDLRKNNKNHQEEINTLARYYKSKGNYFICLTASLKEDINDFKAKYEADYEFYNTDEIQIKTMIRSDPGLILLSKGTIYGKWHYNDLPTIEMLDNLEIETLTPQHEKNVRLRITIIITLLLLSIYLTARYVRAKRKNRL